jgi:hypothetical protein
MKKSLNDSLREEFAAILADPEYRQVISSKKLDDQLIKSAFEKLLSGDRFLEAQPEDIDKTRSEFENYILNTLKTKRH